VKKPGRLLLLPLLLGAALASAHCEGRLAHVFGGYSYDPVQDCLYTSGAIDVIAGADPGQCPMLHCWMAPSGDVYVTDEACDAPPDYVDETQATSGLCVKALAAYARPMHDLCANPPDGGGGGTTL
jgi:hypothetical protein